MRKSDRGRPPYQLIKNRFTDIDRRNLFRISSISVSGAMPRLSGNRNDVLNGLGEWDSMNDLKELLELVLKELKILNLHLESLTNEEITAEDVE